MSWDQCTQCLKVIKLTAATPETEFRNFWCPECYSARPECNNCKNQGAYSFHQEGWWCEKCVPRCETCQAPHTGGNHCEECINDDTIFAEAEAAGINTDNDKEYLDYMSQRTKPTSSLYEKKSLEFFKLKQLKRISIDEARAKTGF
jgi:hypothetical protein